MENVLYELYNVITDRKANPKEGSYTNYLLDKGIDKILKKVGEESSETIIAAKNNDKRETVYEICDLLYHLSVLMADMGITWDDVLGELAVRELKEGNLKKFNVKGDI
ncbi:phosphoribosyl-ATP diphosphatase [Anaerotignum faecicola]|nr:phosphoribosyl-ATP diphosphatase [Anaerotignum faecicola]